jgi:hypothetical protein
MVPSNLRLHLEPAVAALAVECHHWPMNVVAAAVLVPTAQVIQAVKQHFHWEYLVR